MKLSGMSRIRVLSKLIVGLMSARKSLNRTIKAVGIFMDDMHQLDDHSIRLVQAVSAELESDMFVICSSDEEATRVNPRLQQFWTWVPLTAPDLKMEVAVLDGIAPPDLVHVIHCEARARAFNIVPLRNWVELYFPFTNHIAYVPFPSHSPPLHPDRRTNSRNCL